MGTVTLGLVFSVVGSALGGDSVVAVLVASDSPVDPVEESSLPPQPATASAAQSAMAISPLVTAGNATEARSKTPSGLAVEPAAGYARRGMGTNLASLLTESAERSPDAPAIRLGDAELSYAELDERSARLATLLAEKGIGPGDRVGVMLPNVPEFPVAYYGVLRAGAIVVPMNVLLKRREIAFYLEDSGAKLLLAWHGFAAEARERRRRRRAPS